MLHLLRAENAFPSVQRAVSEYLEQRRKELAPLTGDAVVEVEKALIDRALILPQVAPSDPLVFLDDFRHFTSSRKRFMFQAIFVELGLAPSAPALDLRDVSYDKYATWVNLEMCALKILDAFNRDKPELATEADRSYLINQLTSGSKRSVFEADVFAHLLGLLAVRRTNPATPLVSKGIEALLRCQNPDGGFPFIAGWEPFLTAVAGLSLVEAGADKDLLERMGHFVALQQGTDGGWPFAPGVTQSDADCSPYCLEFLRAAGPQRHASQIQRGENYLRGLVNADGGFGTYRRGDNSEVGVTGSAVSALAAARGVFADILDGAVRYLLDRQLDDGTFERGWSLSEANGMFRALLAFLHYPDQPTGSLGDRLTAAIESALHYLVITQNSDGGWGQRAGNPSDVLSTSYSMIALSGSDKDRELKRGLEYLLEQQESDGGYTSIPDSAGPRPIPHDVPVLADAFALLAISQVLASR